MFGKWNKEISVVASNSNSVFGMIGRLFGARPSPESGPVEDIVRLFKGEVFGSVPAKRPGEHKLPKPGALKEPPEFGRVVRRGPLDLH